MREWDPKTLNEFFCFVTQVILVVLGVIALGTITLALGLSNARELTPLVTALGCIVAICAWVDFGKHRSSPPPQKTPMWIAWIFTLLAIASLSGHVIPSLMGFTLWANALVSIGLLVEVIMTFPSVRKEFS